MVFEDLLLMAEIRLTSYQLRLVVYVVFPIIYRVDDTSQVVFSPDFSHQQIWTNYELIPKAETTKNFGRPKWRCQLFFLLDSGAPFLRYRNGPRLVENNLLRNSKYFFFC